MVIISNVICLIALAFASISFFVKERNKLLIFQLICNFFYITSLVLLEAWTGAITMIVGMVFVATVFFLEKYNKPKSFWLLVGLFVAMIPITIFTWAGPISLLPFVSNLVFKYGTYQTNKKVFLGTQIFLSSVMIFYNAYYLLITAMAIEILALIIAIIAFMELIRNNFKGNNMKIERMFKKLKGQSAEIAIFGGSGLEDLIKLENPVKITYKSVGFKFAEVAGHSRHFEFGTFKGKKIVLVSRFHFYESGSAENMWILYTLLHKLGVKSVIATTATGGINPEFKAGDIMLIKDHINLSGANPLIGHLPIEFVDMTNAYDKDLRDEVKKIAKSLKIKLQEGVHVQALGPTYETPAEVIFYRNIGGDSVSMSSAHGNICAKFYKMRFVAFASISNEAATYDSPEITHEEVLRISRQASQKLGKIIEKLIPKL